MRTMLSPVKASPIGDDAYRLLAFPFTGPLPVPGTRGVDLDYQQFTERTDIKPDWLPFRPLDWHHGGDPTGRMGRAVLGKAVDLGRFDGPSKEPDEDGWWVTVWLDLGQKRANLIRKLQERGGTLYGSSETLPGVATVKARDGSIRPWAPGLPGEIVTWPYWRQTLSTSPQNTHSVLRPLKATLDEIAAAGEEPNPAFWTDLEDALTSLGTSLRDLPGVRAGFGKGQDSARILEALASLETAMDRADAVLHPPT